MNKLNKKIEKDRGVVRMQELKLFYFPECPFCKKVLKFIDRKDLNDNIIFENIHESQTAKKELREVGGKIQVPCLFIDGNPLYESNDIITWLKDNEI